MIKPSQPRDSLPVLVGQIISSPGDVFKLIVLELSRLEQEHFWVLLVTKRNQVAKVEELYIGTIDCCPIRPAEVWRLAVRENAFAIIVVHNHPSGDPSPSPQDVRTTRDLVSVGKLLGIELLDHIVIGCVGFVSLKEDGRGFEPCPVKQMKRQRQTRGSAKAADTSRG